MTPWKPPHDYFRSTDPVFILGGGPSMKLVEPERLRGKQIIAVNNAGLDIAPWADVLYWADRVWASWNRERIPLHTGKFKVTRNVAPSIELPCEVHVVHRRPREDFAEPGYVAGFCGGSNAMNLAVHMGARDIVLLGFDMRPGNYHSDHRRPPTPDQHAKKFIPAIARMAPELACRGVRVTNATPGSALKCFPIASVGDVL